MKEKNGGGRNEDAETNVDDGRKKKKGKGMDKRKGGSERPVNLT